MKIAIFASLIMANMAFAEILDFDFPSPMEGAEVAGHVLNADPEVVQISKVSSDQAADLFTALQPGYKHFLYVPTSRLFIASKNDFEIIPIRSRDDDRSGGSVRGGIEATWGDGNGIRFEGYIKGETHDNKGNYVEGRISQSEDGLGKGNLEAGYDSERR